MNTTRLEPLETKRAHEILAEMRAAQKDPAKALGLDSQGRVTGVVEFDDASEVNLLYDLDVHA